VGEPEPEAGGIGDKKRPLLCSKVSELYSRGFNVSNLGIKRRRIYLEKNTYFAFCKMFVKNAQFFAFAFKVCKECYFFVKNIYMVRKKRRILFLFQIP
jgi:hypothetical protein